MEEQLEKLRLAAETDEEAALRFAILHEKFVSEGGLTYQSRCQGVLTSLGFGEQFWNTPINHLSGGQKTRVALARIILSEPDIILLDEPTNHLDIESIEWLEKYLAGCHKTILLISHDRYFLCKVTNRTLEIEGSKAKLYRGNYDYYIAEKKREREIQEHQFKEQQKEIARIEAYIEQQKRWNRERNIIAAESRQKQLDKMERISAPSRLPDPIRMQFSEAEESGYDVLSVRKLSKSYPGRTLFTNLSFELKKKDHLFIIGKNGTGKSTLMKILCGQIPQDSGVFDYGYNVTRGYYDQENQNLNEANTVIDELWDHYSHLTQTEIRNALALFLFKGHDIFKEISILSGGEKARITFAKLMLSKFNLLYMDEPTNHLDIMSREVLEDALADFDGTIVAVSHDRYFIRKLASRVLAFGKDGNVLDYQGTYEDYLRYIERLSADAVNAASAEPVSRSKQDYLLSKQQNAERRKAERQIAKAKEEVSAIEKRLDAIPAEMDEAATDHKKLTALYEEQETLEERLMELLELLDSAGEM
jgi:ATP-binding cassette subfamily F protein 3